MYDLLNQAYQAWIECGRNSAQAADKLNLAVSTFKGRLKKARKIFDKTDPVICFWDIETTHLISAHYELYGINVDKSNVLLDWIIVCGAWQIKGEAPQATSILDDLERFKNNCFDIRYGLFVDDYHVVKTLYDMLMGVDILVHHNGDKFDIKKFNTRAIYHGFPPIRHLKMVDTYKVAKRHFALTSNSLDYACEFFNLPRKIHNEKGLALRVTLCDPSAIKDYVTYNKQDVKCLEALYNKLLPYIDNHPNYGLYSNAVCCPNCGSHNFIEDGFDNTRISQRQAYRCQDCGAIFTDGKTLTKAIMR